MNGMLAARQRHDAAEATEALEQALPVRLKADRPSDTAGVDELNLGNTERSRGVEGAQLRTGLDPRRVAAAQGYAGFGLLHRKFSVPQPGRRGSAQIEMHCHLDPGFGWT